MRATQIGVIARGDGCAGLNEAGIAGSVKKVYDWIKKIVEKEMKKKNYCPK